MDFQKFANLLYSVIGAGNSTHAFTKALFDAIVTDEGQDILDGYGKDSYKAYFNGNMQITKLAQKVSLYVDHIEFAGFIDDHQDAVVQNLCDSFLPYLPDITPHNAGEQLAGLFADIIKDAALIKKKGTSRGAKNEKPSESSRLNDAVFKSGKAVAEAWNSAVTQLLDNEDDKASSFRFKILDPLIAPKYKSSFYPIPGFIESLSSPIQH